MSFLFAGGIQLLHKNHLENNPSRNVKKNTNNNVLINSVQILFLDIIQITTKTSR